MRQTTTADLGLACVHCGQPLGDNTITDQRGVWHEPCYVEVNQPRYEDAPTKLPIEWATDRGYVIGDPDGWRDPDGRSLNDPIGLEEFQRRFASSTVAPLSSLSGQVQFDGELRRSTLDPQRAAELRAAARKYRPQYEAELAAANRAP